MPVYGTHGINDLLQTTDQTVAEYGENRAFETFTASLEAHNERVRDLLGFVTVTQDRLRRYGGLQLMRMQRMDEFGNAYPQKVTAGENVGFPLNRYAIALQWTRDWLMWNTVAELAVLYEAMRRADLDNLYNELRTVIFTPTNATFTDYMVDNVELPVKAFVNADGASIPLGPNGESFDGSTHTHYLATASLAAADITALVNTVIEHHSVGRARIYINQASEATVRGFTSNFTPFASPGVIYSVTAATRTEQSATDILNINNRDIGLWDERAVVSVKPWIPANYMFAYVEGAPAPLVMREASRGQRGLYLAAENEYFPLRAQESRREFGLGVWNRTNGAVLRTNNGTYAAPTLALE